MRSMARLASALAASVAALALPAPAASGQSADAGFSGYVQLLAARARAEGVSEPTIRRMTADLTPNERVIALDRAQPGTPTSAGFPSLANYITRHVDRARINGGRNVYAAIGPFSRQLEQTYGVPAPIIIAIFGHETNYGTFTGNFDLARSLATLAWEGRRRDLFAGEFVALLKIADRGVPRDQLKGSWAGAFGYPQFLPSVYLRLAADGDGDGRADLWSNRADALASIGNYLRDAGWRRDEPWGVAVSVPRGMDRQGLATRLQSPVCSRVHERHSSWKTVREWRQMGVRPLGAIGEDTLATLLEPDGPGNGAWLLTGNYRVILEYNCSNYYAMSVGLLADEITK